MCNDTFAFVRSYRDNKGEICVYYRGRNRILKKLLFRIVVRRWFAKEFVLNIKQRKNLVADGMKMGLKDVISAAYF